MRKEEQRQLLLRGASAWNDWRRDNPSIVPDLSFCVLQGADFRRADLSGTNLYCAWLEDADLRGAKMTGADMGGAVLAGANLAQADLRGALYLTQTQINQSHGDEETQLPEGLTRPSTWMAQPALSHP